MPVGRSSSSTHKKGAWAEDYAKDYLVHKGVHIVAQNWHEARVGEIDIIAVHNNTLIFVEVRFRKNTSYGSAFESVDIRKQNKIIHTAQSFLAKHECYLDYGCRFDVIEVSEVHTSLVDNGTHDDERFTNKGFVAVKNNGENKNAHCEWLQGAFIM